MAAAPSGAGPAGRRLSFEAIVGALNAAIAVGLAFHLARELASTREMTATDFTVFRTGWTLILEGRARDLYDPAAQAAVQNALLAQVGSHGFQAGLMAFLHPPHAALAGCALGLVARALGTAPAFWLWTACSLALLALLVRLVRDELGLDGRATTLAAVSLAAFYPVLETLQQGQVSALLGVAALACVVATRRRRALAAALWLLALSVKPQTLPALVLVLAVRRERRVLGLAALLGAGAVLVTALALGPRVWWDYLSGLPALERYFGVGTPDHMPTVRGLLTRLVGVGRHRALVDALSVAAWLGALAAAGVLAVRARATDGRAAFAAALAFGALASPHLFPQDVLLWIAPLALVLSCSREGAPETWRARSRLALAWPLWFVLARALDIRGTPEPRLPVDLTLVPLVVTTAWAARAALAAPRRAEARG
ncbi:MAG TPA: glycosyltransferase 87 family protein [Polyangia bacterium]|nr:glycosyltransferase 87 family protein [Polyangia bacterium]